MGALNPRRVGPVVGAAFNQVAGTHTGTLQSTDSSALSLNACVGILHEIEAKQHDVNKSRIDQIFKLIGELGGSAQAHFHAMWWDARSTTFKVRLAVATALLYGSEL